MFYVIRCLAKVLLKRRLVVQLLFFILFMVDRSFFKNPELQKFKYFKLSVPAAC